VLLFIALYGVPLYIVLCEILLQGGAQWLTKKCGGKWVKGLDYVYLTFGVLGIIGSASKIEQIKDKFSGVEILALLSLVTAVVIRFIKTRAEIGDWNSSQLTSSPVGGPHHGIAETLTSILQSSDRLLQL